jgi:hypothetical protein
MKTVMRSQYDGQGATHEVRIKHKRKEGTSLKQVQQSPFHTCSSHTRRGNEKENENEGKNRKRKRKKGKER